MKTASSEANSWQVSLPEGSRARVLARASAINLLLNDEQPSYTFDALDESGSGR